MAEQKTVADGDFVMDGVTVWSKSGNTITFDSGVSVWDPQKMNTATSADISNDGHYNYDITITASSTTYMVWIDVQGGSPVVGFEKMQFVANTGGMGGGGMGGGGMGGGNLFSNWVPADEYICTDGMGFWNQQNTCGSPAVQFLYLNKTIRHSYLDQILRLPRTTTKLMMEVVPMPLITVVQPVYGRSPVISGRTHTTASRTSTGQPLM